MIRWFFIKDNDGRAAAIAVVLFLAVIPVLLWNIRKLPSRRPCDDGGRP